MIEEAREELVKLAKKYGYARLALVASDVFGLNHFLVSIFFRNRFDQLLDYMRTVSYNEYDGEKVADALKKMAEKGIINYIEYGREGSELIYVYPPYWSRQNIMLPVESKVKENRRYTEKERLEMFKEIAETFKKVLRADEVTIETINGKPFRVRAWWD